MPQKYFTASRSMARALLGCLWFTGFSGYADVRYHVRWIEGSCWLSDFFPPDPLSVNDAGQVCGYLDRSEYRYDDIWNPDTGLISNVPDPGLCPGGSLFVYDIGNSGHAVGGAAGEDCRGQAWLGGLDGTFVLPGLPGWVSSSPRSLNDNDQVVGEQHFDTTGSLPVACLWDPAEGVIDLGAREAGFSRSLAFRINNMPAPWVMGAASHENQGGVFIWRMDDRTIDLVVPNSGGYGLNDLGQIVGRGRPFPETSIGAFLWTPGDPPVLEMMEFPFDIIDSGAGDINNDGTVTGFYQRPNGEYRPFVWSAARGMRDLMTLIDPCEPRFCVRDVLYAGEINNRGQIVGTPASSGSEYYRPAALLTPYIPGDLDEDGVCDLTDLAIQLSNFGRTGVAYPEGDLDCQGDVDLQDLATLLTNFGDSLP